MNRLFSIMIFCIYTLSYTALASGSLVNNIVGAGASVDITSANGTCKKFTNSCSKAVFVGFHTNQEVSANIAKLPACVSQADCGASDYTWHTFNATAAPAPAWQCMGNPSGSCITTTVALSDGYYDRYAYVVLPTPTAVKTWNISFKAAGGDHNETSYINGGRGALIITNSSGIETTVWTDCISTNGSGSENWYFVSTSYTGDISSIRLHSQAEGCPNETEWTTQGGEYTRIDDLIIN